jgi:cytidylate kinase
MPLVVAIDGPAGSGKSTVAKRVAAEIGATLLDTGAIYRSLAYLADEKGIEWADGPALAELAATLEVRFEMQGERNQVYLHDQDVSRLIRTPHISSGASQVSVHPPVRQALLELQRQFAERGAVVAEGRDVGTVVFPRAQVKVFLVASPEERAKRRLGELKRAGKHISLDELLAQQKERDQRDSERDVAPLKQSEDAVAVDTTSLTIDQVVAKVVALCEGKQ